MPLCHRLGLAKFVALTNRLALTAPPRSCSVRFAYLALVLLLAQPLLLSVAAAGEKTPSDSEEIEEAPLPRLDFQFDEPRMSLGFRGGWAFNQTNGQIYDFMTEQLTLKKSDFDAPAFTVDFSWRVISWLDLVFGVEYSGRKEKSEDRHFVGITGAPIEQRTRLTQVPLTLSLKIYPLGRGQKVGQYAWIRKVVVPYIGGGIGGTWYELKQKGDFVDIGDPNVMGDEFIFSDVFTSDDWAFAQHVFGGVDIKLTRSIGLILEGRYYWAEADMNGDYVGFKPIDLDGARVMIGFNWKL
jgi:opacity protein-like surface antigen